MQLRDFPLSITVAACVTSAALVANVFADPKERAKPIDLSELKATEEKRFAAADADGDGLVTEEEFANVDPQQIFAGVQQPNARNRDGRRRGLGAAGGRGADREAARERMQQRRAEVEARRQEARARDFATADADGDGQLSPDEYGDMPATLKATRQSEMFKRLDADGDGVLTPGEFPSVAGRLAALDTDGDGLVTRSEMRVARGR
ncbi:MAG: hypothetical protein OXU77_11405 [Gammaproteobacteria bacterium]|nr:hypothetical protein [Gammaproteobacteria bacterium]MDE0441884.1 hypothetical protein [Gammaproteobacteria bacterium]